MDLVTWVLCDDNCDDFMVNAAIEALQIQLSSIYPDAGYPDRQLSGLAWSFR